jgi:hypothetical protein
MTIKCKFCQKDFASYSSRSNHVKKFHSEQITIKHNHDNHIDNHNDNHNDNQKDYDDNKKETSEYKCSKCNKTFGFYQNRWRHEKKCIINDSEPIYNANDIRELIKENQELRKLIEKSLKIKPKELEKNK